MDSFGGVTLAPGIGGGDDIHVLQRRSERLVPGGLTIDRFIDAGADRQTDERVLGLIDQGAIVPTDRGSDGEVRQRPICGETAHHESHDAEPRLEIEGAPVVERDRRAPTADCGVGTGRTRRTAVVPGNKGSGIFCIHFTGVLHVTRDTKDKKIKGEGESKIYRE